jgi:hypothetical protein
MAGFEDLMAKASPIINNFTAGELSPLVAARDDLKYFKNGAKYSRNMIHCLQGPSRRRNGTRFVTTTKNVADRSWLYEFEFNVIQSYVMEFGDRYIRFYTNHGQLQTGVVTAWSNATNYVIGDLASRLGVNYYCITAHINQQPPNAAFWYPLTGTIYEIPSPYLVADLTGADGTFNLHITPSNDVVYITSATKTYPVHKLSRLSAGSFKLERVFFTGGPFKSMNENFTATGFKVCVGVGPVSGVPNSVFVLSPAAGGPFLAAHVGSLFYIENADDDKFSENWEPAKVYAINDIVWSGDNQYLALTAATSGTSKPIHTHGDIKDGKTGVLWRFRSGRYIIVRITAFVNTREVNTVLINSEFVPASVVEPIPASVFATNTGSNRWAYGAWSDVEGWPASSAFFRERLHFGRDIILWGSVSADYDNFNKFATDVGFTIVADGAVTLTIESDQSNIIRWMKPLDIALIVGTAGEEHAVSEITDSEPYGPGNIKSRKQSAYGSRHVPTECIGSDLLFTQRAGRKVMLMKYDPLTGKYLSSDQTILSEHITKSGLIDAAYQQELFGVDWSIRADGTLIGFTIGDGQDVRSFHQHRIGGLVEDGRFATVESVESIFSPDGKRDEIWLQVRRVINGVPKRHIEWIDASREDGDDPEDVFYVDAGLTLDAAPALFLTLGVGADVTGTVGVIFVSSAAAFGAGDVGKYIHGRYFTVAVDGKVTWDKGIALITAFTDPTHVVGTITRKFPSIAFLSPGSWRLTVTSIIGLGHLEGQTVDICADGVAQTQKVVVAGVINLDAPAGKIHIGLPCPAVLQPMPISAGAADGTGQGKTGRISRCTIKFFESLGARYGRSELGDMKQIPEMSSGVVMDIGPQLFTGGVLVDWPDDYTDEQLITILQDKPLPCTVVALLPQTKLQDDR